MHRTQVNLGQIFIKNVILNLTEYLISFWFCTDLRGSQKNTPDNCVHYLAATKPYFGYMQNPEHAHMLIHCDENSTNFPS